MINSHSNAYGFSLIELIVVLALTSIIGGLGISFGSASYVRAISESDTELIRAALERARAESQNGICNASACTIAAAHGIYLLASDAGRATQLTLFEGPSFEGRSKSQDVVVPLSGISTITGSQEYIFSAYAATTTEPSMKIGRLGTATTTIAVNALGGISL